ncbi:ABC transporter ATP-binding protein [Streptomyces sp. NPDC046821]|uniref:ABC transporter ATP-binding protein n=1 Tax=Streptomyces sp. NPDC046821 TaxID=3154702 RepID=UPI0033D69BF5
MRTKAKTSGAVAAGQENTADAARPLLSVSDLVVECTTANGPVRLVDGFNLTMKAGERVALVGESGSGKTVTARSIMRLDPGFRLSGSIELQGQDLLALGEKDMAEVRGHKVGMVFQDPMSALNPLMTIGAQVMEPLRAAGLSKKVAHERARSVLEELGVANATQRMQAYPHEFSGGMRQRVVLAMALAGEPALLIADEPTTALDVRVQEQVLTLLDKVSCDRGLAVLLITHDLGTVAGFAHRVAVMYSGRKIHEGGVDEVYAEPAHPYTAGLLEAVPRIDVSVRRLPTIVGSPPHPSARPDGCAFHPRCSHSVARCQAEKPELTVLPSGGLVACHRYGEAGEEAAS